MVQLVTSGVKVYKQKKRHNVIKLFSYMIKSSVALDTQETQKDQRWFGKVTSKIHGFETKTIFWWLATLI